MVHEFKYSYAYNEKTVENWNSDVIGVYYCGQKSLEGKLIIFYIGSATSKDGIRGRLLQHLAENKWLDVTHFGYHVCDTAKEATDWEAKEIAEYKPKYNKQGI